MCAQLCQVPLGAGQRLRISWGPGSELHCCSIGSGAENVSKACFSTAVQWYGRAGDERLQELLL